MILVRLNCSCLLFGDKPRSKLEAAAALEKVAYRTDKGASKQGFGEATLGDKTGATGVAGRTVTALGNHQKRIFHQDETHQQTDQRNDNQQNL